MTSDSDKIMCLRDLLERSAVIEIKKRPYPGDMECNDFEVGDIVAVANGRDTESGVNCFIREGEIIAKAGDYGLYVVAGKWSSEGSEITKANWCHGAAMYLVRKRGEGEVAQ